MANDLPHDPDSLRKKASAYRTAAAVEASPERRRAFIVIAAEYDKLADALEAESDAPATDETQARPTSDGRSKPKSR